MHLVVAAARRMAMGVMRRVISLSPPLSGWSKVVVVFRLVLELQLEPPLLFFVASTPPPPRQHPPPAVHAAEIKDGLFVIVVGMQSRHYHWRVEVRQTLLEEPISMKGLLESAVCLLMLMNHMHRYRHACTSLSLLLLSIVPSAMHKYESILTVHHSHATGALLVNQY